MLSLGVFGRKCMTHYKNVISDICLHPNCDTRILCAECRHNHPNDHKPQLKPITHFLQSDIKNDVSTVKGMLSEIDTFHDNITALFENTLNKVKQEFSELIDKKKEEISKIIKPKKAKDEVYWQHIENELLNIQKLCLTATEPNTDGGYILLATYIDKYIEFQEKFEGVEGETQNLGSPISFKELENKHEKLLEQIQLSLDAFEKSLFENFPKEQFAPPAAEHFEEKKENQEEKVEVPEVKAIKQTFDINNLKVQETLNLSSPIGWDSIEYLGEMNLIALGNDLGVLELWSCTDYKMVHSSKVHQSYINCVKYSKNRKKIITTSVDKTINVMEVLPGPNLKNLKRLEHHKDKVFALLVIDDLDIFISSGREPDLRIWDLKNQDFKYKISTGGKNYTGTKMEFIPQKNLVVVSFRQGNICLYNVKTGEEVYSLNTLSSEWMHAILYLEKRSELLVGVSKGKIMSWKFQGDKLEPSRIFMIPGDIPSGMVPVDNEESVVLSSKSEEIICLDLNTSKYEASKTLDFKAFLIKDLSSLKKFVVASSVNKVAVIDYS